jgi:carboxylesterase
MTTRFLLFTAAIAVLVIAASRAFNRWRARQAARRFSQRPLNSDGVVVGAEPLYLAAPGDRGILLLHGFNDTPQSVAELAQFLHREGWSVSVPLLPGHGGASETLAHTGSADAWIQCARAEWAAVRAQSRHAVLAGQSMGGAIAVILATEHPPTALVLLAPYLAMGAPTRVLARVWPLWQFVVPQLFSDPNKGLRDLEARKHSLGGGPFTPRLVRELLRVVHEARSVLSSVRAPSLVLQARHDYRIPSRSAAAAFALLGSADKTLIWRDRAGHVLASDEGRKEVFALISVWLDRHCEASILE